MASKQMVHMNQGQGETSYAGNSGIQSARQGMMGALIEAAVADLYSSSSTLWPRNIVIADLGCSVGANALALVSTAIDAIHSHFHQLQEQPPPEVSVFLNDLPGNDFNMVVKSLVSLRQCNEPVVVTGVVPGSFYERLFTSGSMDLICSSNSLHWLSKAPEELRRNGIPAYDTDEHLRRERLPLVVGAYAGQSRDDFTLFLKLRSKELVQGGQMVVSLSGRRSHELNSISEFFHLWEPAAQALCTMATKGVIDKEKFNSFYIPIYGPSHEELKEIIQEEGSFSIREMQVHNPRSGVDMALFTPNRIANALRAVYEPMIVQHFGSSGEVMNEFVSTLEQRFSQDVTLQDERAKTPTIVLAILLAKA